MEIDTRNCKELNLFKAKYKSLLTLMMPNARVFLANNIP